MRMLVAVGLLGCSGAHESTAESWSAAAIGAPPAELSLTVPELVAGEVGVVEVTGAAPGATVHLVTGAPGDGACPPALDGGCLGVLRAKRIATAAADDAGNAVFELAVPPDLALGTRPSIQAVSLSPAVSEVVTSLVVSPDAKPDFHIFDVNDTSPTFDTEVSPRDYLEKVSGWYFGHAT
ncbi:MAG: hypothetical protein ACI8PZ_003647 [Myxococcota bacterium]|jgi:hypothetical protein